MWLRRLFHSECGEDTALMIEFTPAGLRCIKKYTAQNKSGQKHSFHVSLWSKTPLIVLFFSVSGCPYSCMQCTINLNSMHMCLTLCD